MAYFERSVPNPNYRLEFPREADYATLMLTLKDLDIEPDDMIGKRLLSTSLRLMKNKNYGPFSALIEAFTNVISDDQEDFNLDNYRWNIEKDATENRAYLTEAIPDGHIYSIDFTSGFVADAKATLVTITHNNKIKTYFLSHPPESQIDHIVGGQFIPRTIYSSYHVSLIGIERRIIRPQVA